MVSVENDSDFSVDDFEAISEGDAESNSKYSHFSHSLGARQQLALKEIVVLKDLFEEGLGREKVEIFSRNYALNSPIKNLKIAYTTLKLQNIPVTIEKFGENEMMRLLVKVGPCDLGGAGGEKVRTQIIKNLVTQALQEYNVAKESAFTIPDVDISAVVGVRGRLTKFLGLFSNNREKSGSHMNAYIKTKGEKYLTLWEPRDGPQSFFNDTLCALIIAATTFIFEYKVSVFQIHNAQDATQSILKSRTIKEIFTSFEKKSVAIEDALIELGEVIKKIASPNEVSQDVLSEEGWIMMDSTSQP